MTDIIVVGAGPAGVQTLSPENLSTRCGEQETARFTFSFGRKSYRATIRAKAKRMRERQVRSALTCCC